MQALLLSIATIHSHLSSYEAIDSRLILLPMSDCSNSARARPAIPTIVNINVVVQ